MPHGQSVRSQSGHSADGLPFGARESIYIRVLGFDLQVGSYLAILDTPLGQMTMRAGKLGQKNADFDTKEFLGPNTSSLPCHVGVPLLTCQQC